MSRRAAAGSAGSGLGLGRTASAGDAERRLARRAVHEAAHLAVQEGTIDAALVTTRLAIRQEQLGLPRQASRRVELEVRVVGGAWAGAAEDPPETCVLRCEPEDSLAAIRELAAHQLPWLREGFTFVRWTAAGRLCRLADDAAVGGSAAQFRARHFLPAEGGLGLICVICAILC